ncbi:hypothetical protein VCB98_07425 [Gammaproteobacteria bacterium AB-CW1]|uniref:Tetratricopeptide repeat protein n=1 Tax=Natronospira elongata TaxID=3110268 RepID=A0AAP6JIC4_9GAMM|nr:hypothetical protein [Gammaproteobacteria bacterium AB-CW1]
MRLFRLCLAFLALSMTGNLHAFDKAQSHLDEWRPDLALEHLETIRDEDSAHWHRMKGITLLALEENERGLENLEKAVSLEPEDGSNHWYLVGGLLAQLDDSGIMSQVRLARQIRNSMEAAVEQSPDNPEYRFGLMQFHLGAPRIIGGSNRRPRQGRDALKEMDEYWGLAAEAIFLLDDDQGEAGLEMMRAAWNNGEGVEMMGMSIAFNAITHEHWELAYETLSRILELEPEQYSAAYQMGRLAALSGKWLDEGQQALEVYSNLPFITPGSPSRAAAFWRLGEIDQHRGEMDAAKHNFRMALELDPDHDDAREAMEKLEASLQAGDDETGGEEYGKDAEENAEADEQLLV